MPTTAEHKRLDEARRADVAWRKWGPYLSERQWGTVREDYSENGAAWDYFTHDHSRSRAYHWGEDGIAGISDDKQRLCFAIALWNGRDPILKERMFGLTNSEGNHGEDVKEYYFYLDSTPTHSYMQYLYKYPQAEYPYFQLVKVNSERGRGRELGDRELHCEGQPKLLFTENETNNKRLFGTENFTPHVKDAFHEYVVGRRADAVSKEGAGTKSAAHYELSVPAGETTIIRLRLTGTGPKAAANLFGTPFEALFSARLQDADELYKAITPVSLTEDEARVMRQALAGMLWGKQHFSFDAERWLKEHGADPMKQGVRPIRNHEWYHMVNDHVISMPDKWEYPWYAAWDLAFHCVALSTVDPDFAREQLNLMLREVYMHPSGQIPAYEWNYSDVNPPVHAWATLFIHRFGVGDRPDTDFLKSSFLKLGLNFNWWVNRKDRSGQNVLEGGFLGLDNIGVFDRSAPLPTGGYLEQADGTAWVAFFCQNMIELSVEIAATDPSFMDMCLKYVEHFFWIASGMNRIGPNGMWDEQDGFYYDVLRLPDGTAQRLKVRSIVGLLPLCATTVVEEWQRERVRPIADAWNDRLRRMPGCWPACTPPAQGIEARRDGASWLSSAKSACVGFCRGCWMRTSS